MVRTVQHIRIHNAHLTVLYVAPRQLLFVHSFAMYVYVHTYICTYICTLTTTAIKENTHLRTYIID